jgi:hypothetical protein
MDEENRAWEELKLLQNSFIKIWQSYMVWFSWHFFVHLTAIGAVLTVPALQEHALLASAFMGFFGLLGAGAAVQMASYDYAARRRFAELETRPASTALLASPILGYARWACLITKAMLVVAWIVIGLHPPVAAQKLPEVPPTSSSK